MNVVDDPGRRRLGIGHIANVVEPAGHTRAYLGQLEGATSILRATRTRFRVIVMHSEPSSLAAVARSHGWVLSWVGDAGGNTGGEGSDQPDPHLPIEAERRDHGLEGSAQLPAIALSQG